MFRQKGFVLLQVMLAFSILVIIVAQLQYKQRVQIQRTQQSLFISQAQSYINGFMAMAIVGLKVDIDDNQTDHLSEVWNQPIKTNLYDGWVVDAELNDLQGRFNVNWLSMESGNRSGAQKAFNRLLALLNAKPEIAAELYKWLDKDSGIDFDYSDEEPSYAPSFHTMADVSELMLLKSVDKNEYDKIYPYLSALPADSLLNVNTAPKEVLMSIASFIDEQSAADTIVKRDKDKKGFASIDDFKNMNIFTKNKNKEIFLPLSWVTLSSEWFSSFARMTSEDRVFCQRNVLYRDSNGITVSTFREQSAKASNRIPGDPKISNTSTTSSGTQQSGTPPAASQSLGLQCVEPADN